MRRLSKKRILEKLEFIFREASPPAAFDPNKEKSARLFFSTGVAFVLDGNGLKTFHEAVDSILEDEAIEDRFSRKYIAEFLQRFVASGLRKFQEGELNILKELDEKLSELYQSQEKYTVIIPIEGIKFQRSRPLNIGKATIRLCRKRDLSFPKLRKHPRIKGYLDGLEGKVIGIVEAQGEPVKAQEKAFNHITKVLNVLRFYVRAFHYRSTDVQIRTMPEVVLPPDMGPLIYTRKKLIVYSGGRTSGLFSFTLSNNNLKKMRRLHFAIINDLLIRDPTDLAPFQKELLLAIDWYGTAVNMTDPVLKFLNYAIVLEVLLSKQERESDRSITDKIAEGAAFVLGLKYENRVEIKGTIKRLYGIRSAIVHAGKAFVEEKDVREIELAAFFIILNLLKRRNRFQTKDDLLAWLEKKRLK